LDLAVGSYGGSPEIAAQARAFAGAVEAIDPQRGPPDRAAVIDALMHAERVLSAMYAANMRPPVPPGATPGRRPPPFARPEDVQSSSTDTKCPAARASMYTPRMTRAKVMMYALVASGVALSACRDHDEPRREDATSSGLLARPLALRGVSLAGAEF